LSHDPISPQREPEESVVVHPDQQAQAEGPQAQAPLMNALQSMVGNYVAIAGETLKTIELLNPGTITDMNQGVQRIKKNMGRIQVASKHLQETNIDAFALPSKAGESTKQGMMYDLQTLPLRDQTATRDHAGLSPLEAMVITLALPLSDGHRALTRESGPEMFLDFDAMCRRALKSDDKYVKRYLAANGGKYLQPRVVIVDDETPSAMACNMLWSKDPVVVITTGLINSLTRDELNQVFRHELAHCYKLVRDHHLVKTVAEANIPFHNARHAEEYRADTFLVESHRELRQMASVLSKLGDVFTASDEKLKMAMSVLESKGLFDAVAGDMRKHVREILPKEKGVMNWAVRTAGTAAGDYFINKTRKELKKTTGGIIEITEDGGFTPDNSKTYSETTHKTHPSIKDRVARLEKMAGDMEKGAKISSVPPRDLVSTYHKHRDRVVEAQLIGNDTQIS